MNITLSDECKDGALSKMGEGLGNLYLQLVSELIALDMKWRSYCLLFRVNEERVALLNEWLSGEIASFIQESMLDSVVLSISIISDNSKSAFSIKKFPTKMESARDIIPIELLKAYEDAMETASSAVKQIRDKHIAHHCWAIYASSDVSYVYPTYEKVDEVCKKYHFFANAVAEYWNVSPPNFCTKSPENTVERFFCRLSGENFNFRTLMSKKHEWEYLADLFGSFAEPTGLFLGVEEK